MNYLVLSLFICLFGSISCEGEAEKARLLAAKRVHNLYLVEGKDIVVSYSLHNIGSTAAVNVQLTDAGFG